MAQRSKSKYDEPSLYDYAVAALGRRMHSVAELKRKLRSRTEDEAVIDSVIARLKEQRYLSDTSYAAAYSASRRDNQKFGRRRVTTDLKIKGIHSDVIRKAVDETFAGINELALARQFLRRKRFAKPATNRETARIFRALLRAGFGASTAIRILKSWDVEDEILGALQEEAEVEE